MAKPVINNLTALEIGYTGTTRPAVRINMDIFDADAGELVNLSTFQYVKASNKLDYTPSNTNYLENWILTNAYMDDIYVDVTRQGLTDSYVVELYNDVSKTELIASGTGNVSTNITLTESNDSGVSGTVDKNNTHLGEDGTAGVTLTNNTVWSTASTVSGTQPITNISASTQSPGRSNTFYWNIINDLSSSVDEDYYFRVQATETNAPNETSLTVGYGPISIYIDTPVVSVSFPSYTNQRTFEFEMSITGQATQFRAAETETALSGTAWSSITESDGKYYGNVYFSTTIQEDKTVWIEIADNYYNRSAVINDVVNYHTQGPENVYLKITGTANNSYYTGVLVNEDGSLTLSDVVALNLYATDLTSIQMYIDGHVKDGNKVRTWIPFETDIEVRMSGTFLGGDTENTVQVTFRDEAGNTTATSESIRYNTKVYDFGNDTQGYTKNLREPSSDYDHQIMETSAGGSNLVIDATEALAGDYIRKWNDIFYPETHSYPTNPDGSIDESAAIAMNESSNENYDAVDLDSGQINYDSEDRVTTVGWTKDGTKDYLDLESSYEAGLRYWIIDNTGYGDFYLEFEHFYLDNNSYVPPYNNMAPYDGDSVVIYDASEPGCIQEQSGAYGQTEYVLLDASKLEELQAYTGKGNQVYSLTTGRSMNANSNGGFTTSEITTTSTICVVLYSDASVTASGFKIKAGPKHDVVWYNYDVDEENGKIWIHKYPLGNAPNTEVRAIYDYYDSKVEIDYDKGEVTFDVQPSGVVTADYSYYNYGSDERPDSRLFACYNDDFVDYLDVDLYVQTNGIIPPKSEVYIHDYPDAANDRGKLTQYYSVDKDRGLVEFADASGVYGDEYGYVPKGRIFGDYKHHTFLRLSNDGYGNFTFHDETLVADDTPQYPDYTFGDIKMVNEGDAILEDGKLKFLPRGYDTDGDGTVDQVLDVNRPWDVQQGSASETYNKTAAEIRTNYTWDPTCTKSQATSILSNWQNRAFGFDCYPEQVWYGRVAWVLSGTSGSYPTTTSGNKSYSSSIEGKFYSIET